MPPNCLSCFGAAVAVLFLMTSFSEIAMTSSLEQQQYVARVRIYVDPGAEAHWRRVTGHSTREEFWREMNSTYFEINQIYQSLKPMDVDLQLQIGDIVFLNEGILNTNNGKIFSSQAAHEFHTWAESHNSINHYDMAVLYTGANLLNDDLTDTTYGYSYVGTVCTAKGVGVIELKGTYTDVLSSAHELGHILGANHDGSQWAKECPPDSGFIMNAWTKDEAPKHFFFSNCSANSIKNVMDVLNKNNDSCMTSWSPSEDIKGPRYGSLLTPDENCRRNFGARSYVSRMAYKTYGDSVCTQIACMTSVVNNYFSWNFTVTPQGLKCGENKVCHQGQCVVSADGSADVSDTCPFGDQPRMEGDMNRTCNGMSTHLCQAWRTTCCHTCRDPGTADEVCQRLMNDKHSALARPYYSQGYGDKLCSRLVCVTASEEHKLSGKSFTAPDRMKCGKNKWCSKGKCVPSSLGDASMSDACPYGDQPWLGGGTTCESHVNKHGCSEKVIKHTCCASCGTKDPGTADEVCQGLQGKNSALARRAYSLNGYGDQLCSKLACLTSTKGTGFWWNTYQAPDGMKCGQNKRCSAGKCVHSVSGDPGMSDSCPYGDQPWLGGDWQRSCADQIRQNGCSERGWNETCCASCSEQAVQ